MLRATERLTSIRTFPASAPSSGEQLKQENCYKQLANFISVELRTCFAGCEACFAGPGLGRHGQRGPGRRGADLLRPADSRPGRGLAGPLNLISGLE